MVAFDPVVFWLLKRVKWERTRSEDGWEGARGYRLV
jgi:hypothetical protein